MSVGWWDFLFYASFGFVVTSSVSIAGVLLVFCYLIVPSVAAMLYADSVGRRLAIKVLNATVHFNTIADPDYQPLLGPQWQEHGLDTMSATGSNTKNRAITVSEFRHMQKLAAQYPNRFNVYGEI